MAAATLLEHDVFSPEIDGVDYNELPSNPRNVFYPMENVVMKSGKGVYLYDDSGKLYIDAVSGTFNLILGYSNQEIIEVVKKQLESLIHVTSSFQSNPVNHLAQKLASILPGNLAKIHLKVSSGSVANEGAIKMAHFYTGKRDVISFFRSHLGQTYMMMTLSGNAFRRNSFPSVSSNGLIVPDPYCYRCFYKQRPETCSMMCVERINDFIEYASSGQVSCLIAEPISGNGGNIVPPKGYFKALKKLCEEHGIILILDEIQTGFGRTGFMFASEYFGITPNIMTMAKGLGGTGFQIAGIAAEERFAAMDSHHHSFTFGSNVLAAVAGCKTLEIITRSGFLEHVKDVGDYIIDRLRKMKERFPFIGDVRGIGLMIGVEVVKSSNEPDIELTNAIVKECLKNGLIIRSSRYAHGNVFKIRPSLLITSNEAEHLCDILERTLSGFLI